MAPAPACSHLPDEIWSIIGEKLRTGADRIRFRSVCPTWRSLLPFPQPPWLMLAEDESSPTTRGFVGLEQEEEQPVHQFELPEAYHTKTVGSTGTWLITFDIELKVRLLHPFTGAQIYLPPLTTILPTRGFIPKHATPVFRRNFYLKKVVLSSGPANEDCVALAMYQTLKQAYARPGDKSWTRVIIKPSNLAALVDVIFYKGQFHGITDYGVLIAYNLDDDPVTATQLAGEFRPMNTNGNTRYLVECGGALLFVFRFTDHEFDPDTGRQKTYKLKRFEVFKFDFGEREWTPCRDLGEYCLFLGLNTSVAVSVSSHPGLEKNCIYFTDDFTYTTAQYTTKRQISKGHDMGIYDLKDDTVRPHYGGPFTTSMYSPPIWIVPRSSVS